MTPSRARRFAVGTVTYLAILATTLLLLDIVCVALGLFPPRYNLGDADLGWRPATATGKMAPGRCIEFSAGTTVNYQRNEDGIRTSLSREQIMADTGRVRIAVTGDSQTELCAPNAELHAGVLERELTAAGVPTTVLPYGAGRYSPLQAYLAYRKVLLPYHPQVLVLNVYTGNDLYDILRVDDRPYFAPTDSGYRIAEPIWFTLENPTTHHWSRVAFAARMLGDKTGIRTLYLRVAYLRQMPALNGAGVSEIAGYFRDLWRAREPSVGYSDAFTSQMLNQQLFFVHFPAGIEESIRRMKALMVLARQENPNVTLVMSPLPSYQLVGETPVDSALTRTLKRLPISYEAGRAQERALYDRLRGLASDQGWVFVDNLAALTSAPQSGRLFNNFDYHLLPAASLLVGRAQSRAILEAVKRGSR